MRTKHKFYLMFIGIIFFAACSKDATPEPPPVYVQNLIGMVNKPWHLQELYINGVSQVLTNAQKAFVKTYRLDNGKTNAGKVINYDGFNADWIMASQTRLTEVYNNNAPQPIMIDLDIVELSEKKLDYSYTSNSKLIREVYYAN